MQKYPLFDDQREEFGDFSFPSVSFSSEAGKVLTFLLTFCGKTIGTKWKSPTPKQINSLEAKSKSGFGAEAPMKQNKFL